MRELKTYKAQQKSLKANDKRKLKTHKPQMESQNAKIKDMEPEI